MEHDRAYWAGGTDGQKLQADIALFDGIMKHPKGGPWWAVLYFVGVRLGGNPILPLWYRWGYGRGL